MLIKKIYQKNVIFVTIGTLKILVLNMNLTFVMDVMISCKKLWVLIILLLYILRGSAYRIHFWYMSKDDAINIMTGSNLLDKRDVL